MAAYFFDASALVKRYVPEIGSAWVNQILNPTFFRRVRTGGMTFPDATIAKRQFEQDAATVYRILEFTPTVLKTALQFVETHQLRAYDAIQLAAAIVLHSRRMAKKLAPMVLVASDQELLAAALAEGLLVDDPLNHP